MDLKTLFKKVILISLNINLWELEKNDQTWQEGKKFLWKINEN